MVVVVELITVLVVGGSEWLLTVMGVVMVVMKVVVMKTVWTPHSLSP